MFENVLTERVVVIERGVNKVLKYTEGCELFLIGNVAASDPSVFDIHSQPTPLTETIQLGYEN